MQRIKDPEEPVYTLLINDAPVRYTKNLRSSPPLASATMSSSCYIAENQLPDEDSLIEKDSASVTTSTYSIIDPWGEHDPPSDPVRGEQEGKEVTSSEKGSEKTWTSWLFRFASGSRKKEEQHEYGTGEDILTQLLAILDDARRYRLTLNAMVESGQAQKILNLLQAVLDAPECANNESRAKLIVATQRLSKVTELYPSSYELGTINYNHENDWLASGRCSDVYKTWYGGTSVCVKVIKLVGLKKPELLMLKKKFAEEAILWRQLCHINVIPFYGFCKTPKRPCLVSPWMENGTVNDFLENNPEFDRYLLVTDITSGLQYLHSNSVIHGDLKGVNILIDASKRARLTDFGISSVIDPNIPDWSSQSAPASRGGTRRWQAPELIEQDSLKNPVKFPCNTMSSDIYSWACVCYEIYTGNIPFYENKLCETVVYHILQGIVTTPSRPPKNSDSWTSWGLTEKIWDVMVRCWSRNPQDRPTVNDLVLTLGDEREDDRPPPPLYQHPAIPSSWPWPGYSQKPKNLVRSLIKIHKILHKAGLIDQAGPNAARATRKTVSTSELSSRL